MDSKDKHKNEEEEEEDDDDEEEEEEASKKKKTTPKVASREEKSSKEESKKKAEKEIDPDSDGDERTIQRKKSPKSKGAAKKTGHDKQKERSNDPAEGVENLSLKDESKSCSGELPEASQSDEPISIIREMWNTVLDHENGYIKGLATYLVCKINGEPGRICIKSTEGTHAEEKLTNYLKAKYIATPDVTCTITVYINNSPCHMCAQKLKEFLQKFENIELVLYVTHLYNIRRLSCQLNWVGSFQQRDKHMGFIDVNDYEKNYQGLRDLMNLGENRCRIDAFTEYVWKALHEVMDIEEGLKQTMMTKYTETTKEEHVRNRISEDINIKQDLAYIQENSDPWEDIARIKYYKTK